MFREVSSKLNIAEREEEILEFWQSKKIFEKSLELRSAAPEFVFYEGPPTANGRPGIHHVLSRTVKDIVCRFKSMKGFLVRRKAGWDTHGLPVEIEIEKQLKINGKDEIEKYGIARFNEKCRKSVFEYKREWDNLTNRIGYWLDLENPYITFTNEYIESVWWILKEIWKKGLLYQGFKILPYCPRCETPLSSHEVSQGYKDVEDPSIYVRIKKNGSANTYFLVWTTTPWTLISNVALAVNPEIEYVEIQHNSSNYILAKERVADLFSDSEYQIRKKYKGSDLEGIEYERLFNFLPVEKKAFYIIAGDFVTTEDGTGIVHIAPAFGEDDYQAGLKYDLPLLRPVDKSGRFEDAVTSYKGQFVKSADEFIISDLKNTKQLIKKLKIEHSYPHCWRCTTPLIYYARESWYIKTSQLKDKLIANNNQINWYPPELGTGRFNEWLKNNVDWALSRDRFWGTPLNIWICTECQHETAIGSIEELRQRGEKVPQDLDLHKPSVDEVTIKCEKCAGQMKRVPELIDVWFDSGSMPYAQYHYPFENKEQFAKNFPADFICEGIDQTRGWFYSLLAISTLLFDKPAFKNIVVNELILDRDGQKMSKSKGNVVVPEDIISKYGSDTLRWYLMSASPPWTPKRFDEEGIKEVLRKFINTFLNTYSFFVLYANIDQFDLAEKEIAIEDRQEIDRWILSKFYGIVEQVNNLMDVYEITRVARMISSFIVDDLSNWYIRRNRRRFWKSEDWQDKLAAYQTLYEILYTLSKITAPFIPFMAEDIYTNLRQKDEPESVHFCDFPTPGTYRDEALEQRMSLVQVVVSVSHSLRNDNNIKVRQPLQRILIFSKENSNHESLRNMEDLICDEVNIKSLEIVSSSEDLISRKVKPNYKTLGPKLGKMMGKVTPIVQSFSNEQILNLEKKGFERVVIEGQDIKISVEDVDIYTVPREGFAVSVENGLTVALDLTLTDDLLDEGLARELINRVQNLRKDANYAITDRIHIYLRTESALLKRAISNRADHIMSETLALVISEDMKDNLHLKELSIGDESFVIGLENVKN
jgi:isoleucyl-tRNA synthetase